MLWALAYAVGAMAAAGTHRIAFPIPATILNVTWEAVFVFWRPPARRTTRAMYALWLAFDLVLLVQAWTWLLNRPLGHPLHLTGGLLLLLGLPAGVIVHVVVYRRFRQPALEAFVLNAVMSLLFVLTALAYPQHLAPSVAVAVSKLLGTALISLANVVSWRASGRRPPWGPCALMSSILILDLGYLGLLAAGPSN